MRITGNDCLLLFACLSCIATVASHILGRVGHLNHQNKKREVQCEDSKLVVNPTRNTTHVRIITDSGKILFSLDNTNGTEDDIRKLLVITLPLPTQRYQVKSPNHHIIKRPIYNGLYIKILDQFNSILFEKLFNSGVPKQFKGSNSGLSDAEDICFHLSGFNLLLEPGLDVNHRDGYNMTSLLWAAYFGSEEIARDLVQKGANVNTRGLTGFTPLLAAVISGKDSLVEYLIKHGAQVNARVPEVGSTPLHLAFYFKKLKIVKILIDNGADVSSADNTNGATPLHYAIEEQHIDIAKELIAKGSDVNAKANNGMTPLLEAIVIMNEELIDLLLQKGADVNSRNTDMTPLILVIIRCEDDDSCLKLVKHLIERYNPDVNLKLSNGKTALSMASEKGFSKVRNYLKAHGAT